MTDLLLPPGGTVVAPVPRRTALVVAAAALAAALLHWSPLLAGGALSGRDWSSHHFHYYDFVRTSLRHYSTLPLYMSDAVITPNFLANAESPLLSPLVPLLLVLDTGVYLELLIVLFTAAGLAGAFLLLRDLDVPTPVAAFFAIAFAGGGFFPAHLAAGHPWALGALLLPGLLCLYRRAALGSGGALWLAAALGACVIGGGQHQPFVWQHLFLAGFAALWAARVRAVFPLARLALLFAATAGLAAPKLLPMLAEFADYAPTARTQGLPAALLATTLAARGQHPGLAPAGLVYTHGAGWWEYAFYTGPVALAGLVAGLAAARRGRLLLVLGAVFLGFSLAPPFRWLDAWSLVADLPILRTQRSPSRFLVLALFACELVAALGLARLWRAAAARSRRAAVAAGIGACALLALDLHVESRAWLRATLGEPIAERDHRPLPLVFRPAPDARVELVGFEPNALVYAVRTPRRVLVSFPLRWGRARAEWTIDGLPALASRGRLAAWVDPGEHRIAMTYRPAQLSTGLVVFAGSLLALLGFLLRRRRRVG